MNKTYNLLLLFAVAIFVFNVSSAQWIAQTSGTTNTLFAVSFTDASTGTAVGTLGTILRTTDGGVTWTAQTSNTTNTLWGVFFVNASIGTAVGNNGTIRRTTDGGTTWVTQTSGVPTSPLYGVSFSSADVGTIVGGGPLGGPGSTIRRTTNGGTTWTAQTPGTTNALRSVVFLNADTGFAVGLNGTIRRTSDGGATWTPQTSNTTQHLFGVSFINTNVGTAVGAAGTILRTTDGGTNWTGQTSGVARTLNAVSFVDVNTGVAVGDSGTILRTTDGGANWISESGIVANNLYGVSLVTAGEGTAVGFGGTILRRTTALFGTKTIGGTAPDYPTIKAAIKDLNANGVVPPGVTFLIRGGTYTEDSLRIRTATSSASAPITFKPDSGATVVINVTPPSTAYDFAIKIDTTQYVTIDGSNNGTTSRDLTINALGTSGRRGVWVSGASHYATIKNCNINAGRDIPSPSTGVVGIDFRFTGTAQHPDFILAENNLIRYAFTGIRLEGTAAGDECEFPVIRNNMIDSVAAEGIYVQTFNNAQIYGNDVNTLRGSTTSTYGIYIGPNGGRARVYNNKIHDLRMLSTTASVRGIYFNSSTNPAAAHAIFNNFVWGITIPATGTSAHYGIWAGSGNTVIPDTIAFNTVAMTGTSSGNRVTGAFYKASTVGLAYVRNNIFHNVRTDGTTGVALAIRKATTATHLDSDNNNLYVGTPDAQHQTGRIQTTDYATLADWRAGNNSDSLSIAENSPFVSPTNLHIQTTSPTLLDSGGVALPGITTDIDDELRDAAFPDIGADEFAVVPLPAQVQLVSPAHGANVNADSVMLIWRQSRPAVIDYWLQVSTDSVFSVLVVNDSTLADTSRQISGLNTNTRHYWRVSARNASGRSIWSTVWSFTTIVSLPAQVQLLSPANGAIVGDSVTFLWHRSQPEVDRYWFELSPDSTFTFTSVDSMLTDTTTLRGFTSGGQYWWRVKAHNAAGWGPFSAVRTFTVVIVGVEVAPQVPKVFALEQNYPNPFNPATLIKYGLPKESFVTLKVYNLLGQEIVTLVNEVQKAGYVSIAWDGRNRTGEPIGSGVYFYRIEARPTDGADAFVQVRKMVMLR
jgi:photosystem II stability/assembly factor-like uncharacterized protein